MNKCGWDSIRRIIQMSAGVILLLFGGMGTYNMLVPRTARIGPESGLLFSFGTAILVAGLLLVWRVSTAQITFFRTVRWSWLMVSTGIVLVALGFLPYGYMLLCQSIGCRPWESAGLVGHCTSGLIGFPGIVWVVIAGVFLYRDKARAKANRD